MTRDEFRALCDEILTPKKAEPTRGRRRPVPKFAFSPTTYMEGWVFHLWRPFLAVRISKNPRNGLMRFEPAFYRELMKLPAAVLDHTLLHTVKQGFDDMEGEPGASRRMTVEIVVRPTNVGPPVMTNGYTAGPRPLIVYANASERLVGEVDLALSDDPHPFRTITKLTERGARNAEPASLEVRAMERCWATEKTDPRLWLAGAYQVPVEWLDNIPRGKGDWQGK
jgi:hypothetical protein